MTAPGDAPAAAPPPIAGVVLAAGRSSRMGRSKALLDLNGRTFLRRAVEALRVGGCARVVAVVAAGAAAERWEAEAAGADVVENPEPASEQIHSLRLALHALSGDDVAAVVLPVDHPLVPAGAVRAVMDAFRHGGAPVVRAAHRGRPGHPTLFARSLFDELQLCDPAHGARDVVAAHAEELVDVMVEDAGVITNVDTPDDYRAALKPGART